MPEGEGGESGWSEREKELLRRLKGKEREVGELMVSSGPLLLSVPACLFA